jgi:hypothetical protein
VIRLLPVLLAASTLVAAQTSAHEAERRQLLNLIDGFLLLSESHDLLHIMMGEEDGDPAKAYVQFGKLLEANSDNPELASVRLAYGRIGDPSNPVNTGAAELDALVDYLQISFQFGHQAIFKAYGHFGEVPTTRKGLEPLKKKIAALREWTELKSVFDN